MEVVQQIINVIKEEKTVLAPIEVEHVADNVEQVGVREPRSRPSHPRQEGVSEQGFDALVPTASQHPGTFPIPEQVITIAWRWWQLSNQQMPRPVVTGGNESFKSYKAGELLVVAWQQVAAEVCP